MGPILDDEPHVLQLSADGVGRGPVPSRSSRVAPGHQRHDLGARLFLFAAQAKPERFLAAFPYCGRQSRRSGRFGPGVPYGFEDDGQGPGRIEVGVHAGPEAGQHAGIRSGRAEVPGFPGEVVEPVDGTLGLLEHFDGHVHGRTVMGL